MKHLWRVRRVGREDRPQRRRLVAFLAVMATLSAASVAVAAVVTHDAWKRWQLDDDRCYDAATVDRNHNGRAEVVWFDVDNDCSGWDTRVWNTVGGDGFLESLTFDFDEDSRWEVWLADTNQRAGYELIFWDDNADGYWDRWNYAANVLRVAERNMIAELTAAAGVVSAPDPPDGIRRLGEHVAAVTGRGIWTDPADRDGDKSWCEDKGYTDRQPFDRSVC